MRSLATKLVAVCLAAVSLSAAASASAAPVVSGFFPVKGLEINNKIVTGPDGNIWVTLSAGKDVARITPAGQVEEFDLDGVEGARGIAPGPDGNLWVPTINEVTKFSPSDPEGTDQSFTIATINAEGQIVAGPDGRMWVASNESVVHFSPADPIGSAQSIAVTLSPKDIDVAGSLIAVADFEGARIATFTTSGAQQSFALAGGPQGVAGGPGGQIAFSQQGVQPEEVGLINPPNPAQGTAIDGDPFGVALGPDGAYWIARSAAGEVIRQTTSGQITTLGGFPAKYFPRQLTGGPGGTLWVTMEIPGENLAGVARVSGVEKEITSPPPPPPPRLVPETTVGKGPKNIVRTRGKKAKVKFRFSSPTPGATFQCWLTRHSKKSRSAILGFKPCESPKVYRLRPGRYQFSVRAVVGGVPDPTPAVRKFKVKRIR